MVAPSGEGRGSVSPRAPAEIAALGLAAFVAVGALLEAVLLVLDRSSGLPTALSLGVPLLGLGMAVAVLQGRLVRWRMPLLSLLVVACAALAVWHVRLAAVPFAHRLLLVATLLALAAAVLHVILLPLPWPRVAERLLLLTTVIVALFGTEVTLGFMDRDADDAEVGPMPGIRWEGQLLPDSVLGERYAPHSTVATYYPDNPRGYFEVVDPRAAMWHLALHRGAGSLDVIATDTLLFRLTVQSDTPDDAGAVQVNQPGVAITAGRTYRLRFRARAEPARAVSFAVSRAEPPWDGLGLYRSVDLTPAWQVVESEFVAEQGSGNARVHFDAGGAPATIEVADLALVDVGTGARLEPAADTAYRVLYQFNAEGCRGPERTIPAAAGTFRILALGDSYVLGIGVHEADALPAQLERQLNARARERGDSVRYEVINCGVSGYSTREERLFYERVARAYQPDLVLLGIVLNDDVSWVEEVRRGWFRIPTRLDRVSRLWDQLSQRLRQRPARDYSRIPVELLRLDASVRADGAWVFPFLFRNIAGPHSTPVWEAVRGAAEPAVRQMGLPFVDLGKVLLDGETEEDLFVHQLDLHPNELAHRRAAAELVRVLDSLAFASRPPGP